jgi:pilus assembly protein CpaC
MPEEAELPTLRNLQKEMPVKPSVQPTPRPEPALPPEYGSH